MVITSVANTEKINLQLGLRLIEQFYCCFSGIALRKVAAQSEAAKDVESKDGSSSGGTSGSAGGGQSDVASILARRVAVEMSDSEEGNNPSDSEYDSDDWGDESTA